MFVCLFMYVYDEPVHAYSYIYHRSGAPDCSWPNVGLIQYPTGVALDPSSGALFVTKQETKTVCRFPPGAGADKSAWMRQQGIGDFGNDELEREDLCEEEGKSGRLSCVQGRSRMTERRKI
jgi:hypothetical protein